MSNETRRCEWCGDIAQGACGCPAEVKIERLSADAVLLAWVLLHPETAAECLEDAAAGDGNARDNLEFRRDALGPNVS